MINKTLNPKLFDEDLENRYEWHGTPPGVSDISGGPPKEEQTKIALEELRILESKIK